MAETYDKLFRRIALRGNLLAVTDGAGLETAYQVATIGQTQLSDRATQFPEHAIQDVLLDVMTRMVQLISLDRNSPYRTYFTTATGNVSSGSLIPAVSSTSIPVQGLIGNVLDSSNNIKLKMKKYDDVVGIASMPTLKQSVYWYYTDNTRIWHTRSNVVIDVVGWSQTDQRTLMNSTPTRGNCPFPESLHEGIVCGALSLLFRGSFNNDQAPIWRSYFNDTLQVLGANINASEIEKRIISE